MATTRTGFPAIPTPRALELRPVQQSIDNIRERFQSVEAQLTLISSLVGASTSAQAIQSLQAQINSLLAVVNALVGDLQDLGSGAAAAATAAFGPPGMDGEPGQDAPVIPGPRGEPGRDGYPLPGQDGEDGADGIGVPGAAGATGATGPAGASMPGVPGADGEDGVEYLMLQPVVTTQITNNQTTTVLFLQGEDGQDASPIPGIPGAAGAAGATGPAGVGAPSIDGEDGEDGIVMLQPTVTTNNNTVQNTSFLFMQGDDGEDAPIIPGARGQTGAPGAGGSGATGTATINFGATPVGSGSVTVVDAALSGLTHADAFFMGSDSTGDNGTLLHRQAGALLKLTCDAPSGSNMMVSAESLFGRVTGQFLLHYRAS